MEGKTLKPDLRVPEQKTASLSFCDTTPKAFRVWIDQLPMANIGEVSRQLYHAIIELNHLFLAPQQRMQFLELIREKIHFVCNELSRHYLGLAVALPEKQRKIANLSQALQLHLAGGYKLCVLEFIDNGGLDKNRRQIATAAHRAISELSATILRSHQLYCPSPAQSWLECHRLFRFAHRNKLSVIQVDDDTLQHRRASSVADAGNDRMPVDRIKSGNLCGLLARYLDCRFVLMHIAYPYCNELVSLTKHYRNVYADLCWAWSIDPYSSCDFVRRFIHAAPANKLFAFGGDTGRHLAADQRPQLRVEDRVAVKPLAALEPQPRACLQRDCICRDALLDQCRARILLQPGERLSKILSQRSHEAHFADRLDRCEADSEG